MECPHCLNKFEPWLCRLPKDIDLLANKLGLPVETVTQLISNNAIPLRTRIDSLGRRRGTYVMIHEAFERIWGSAGNTQ